MEIITLHGKALADLLADVTFSPGDIRTLRVARDGDTVKFKVNEYTWSPPYPRAEEDARRTPADI